MNNNPYAKYLGKEDILQNQVMRYIGLKYPRTLYTHVANKPTENQKKWLKELNNANWVAVWSNNLDECLEIIDNYFNNK